MFAHWSLPAVVLVSGSGTGVMCLLVLVAVIAVIGLVQRGGGRAGPGGAGNIAPDIAQLHEQLLGVDKRLASGVAAGQRERAVLDDGLETRITNTQAAIRQVSGELAHVQASVSQIERTVAAETMRAAARRAEAARPRVVSGSRGRNLTSPMTAAGSGPPRLPGRGAGPPSRHAASCRAGARVLSRARPRS